MKYRRVRSIHRSSRTCRGTSGRANIDSWTIHLAPSNGSKTLGAVSLEHCAVEPTNQRAWESRLFEILKGFRFPPGGRIQAGAGTQHNVTLFNCFVMGTIEDNNSISKTISVPESFPFERFKGIYDLAYDKGIKGCTTYRPNPIRGAVVTAAEESGAAPHCCVIEREAD